LSAVQTRQDFARELTALRERASLTVRDVAKAVGEPSSTVGGYFSGRHLPPLRPPDQLRNILQACGVTDPTVIDEWLETLNRVRRMPGPRSADTAIPYRGLASFQPDDAGWFYGRENLVDVIIGHLRELYAEGDTGGLLFVIGPSGSGKSSLLRAGVIPALRSGALGVAGSADWPVVLFTPGAEPSQELAGQLARVSPAGSGRVLVVDQFEEVFTACPDDRERAAFIQALCYAAWSGALVVLGLRADFYPHALRYPELVPALQHRQVVVGPMTEAELRSAITEPARKARLEIEPGLVEVLLRDLAPAAGDAGPAYESGSLPLMSHALLTTWERASRGRLTVADYRAAGGIEGAVASTAEEAFGELTEAQQELARQIFIRLVHVADDTADTRRRVSASELVLGADDADHVLGLFIERRLITAGADEVEIAHEALLSAWPRLRGWIDADRAGGRVQRQLSSAAELWRDADRDPNALYRGGPLASASDWAGDPVHRVGLNVLEREFLQASVEHQATEGRAARRRTRGLQQLVGALAVLTLVAGFLAVFAYQQKEAATHQRDLAISRQVAIDADQLRATDPALAAQLALAAYRIAPTPEARSSLLESYETPTVTRILGPAGVMQSVAFARGGTLMAAAGENSVIRLWDLAHSPHPAPAGPPLHGGKTVFSVAFSPDGRTLATAGAGKTVQLWDVRTPGHVVSWGPALTGPRSTVYSVAFSPDGDILAAGSADDTVRLWDVANPRHPVLEGKPLTWPHSGFVQSVAFSPNGKLLAAGSAGGPGGPDGTVRMWAVANARHPAPVGPVLTGQGLTVYSVAFSPDSDMLAAGSAVGKVQLWNVADRRHPTAIGKPLSGPDNWINSVAFSPDGRSLAAASSDSKVWVWDLATGQVTTTLPHPRPVTSVQFLGNSQTLATSDADGVARIWHIPGPAMTGEQGPFFTAAISRGHVMAVASLENTARLWDVADPRRPVPLGPVLTTGLPKQGTGAAALSPDGRTLVVGEHDGTSQVLDVRNPADPVRLALLPGPTRLVESITFSPNGRLLAVASDDKSVWLWNITDPRKPVELARLTNPHNYVFSAAFSPNSRLLAAASADQRAYLWNISAPRHPILLAMLTGARSYVYSVAFSRDGQTLAVGSADGDVQLWNVVDPGRPARLGPPLTGPTSYVYSVFFSPDGRTLAATSGDGSTWLWDVASVRQPSLLATLTGADGAVYAGSFNSSGNILYSAGAGSTVSLWDVNVRQVAAYVCATAGDRITRGEWRQYIPGLPYHPPC
jgi:WD40 repeat protein/transcriptional regulator with XRE-family HTH domain